MNHSESLRHTSETIKKAHVSQCTARHKGLGKCSTKYRIRQEQFNLGRSGVVEHYGCKMCPGFLRAFFFCLWNFAKQRHCQKKVFYISMFTKSYVTRGEWIVLLPILNYYYYWTPLIQFCLVESVNQWHISGFGSVFSLSLTTQCSLFVSPQIIII